MSIILYYTNSHQLACSEQFSDKDLSIVLKRSEHLRKNDNSHICISTELDCSVGKAGVTSIEHGKTPDGFDYDWSKQHRGAGPAKNDTIVTI